jgi:hypothetical protein
MKNWRKPNGVPFLIGAVLGSGLLERYFKFTFPQATILTAVLASWWAINRKVEAINEQTESSESH